jgi:hypothetical protein
MVGDSLGAAEGHAVVGEAVGDTVGETAVGEAVVGDRAGGSVRSE